MYSSHVARQGGCPASGESEELAGAGYIIHARYPFYNLLNIFFKTLDTQFFTFVLQHIRVDLLKTCWRGHKVCSKQTCVPCPWHLQPSFIEKAILFLAYLLKTNMLRLTKKKKSCQFVHNECKINKVSEQQWQTTSFVACLNCLIFFSDESSILLYSWDLFNALAFLYYVFI